MSAAINTLAKIPTPRHQLIIDFCCSIEASKGVTTFYGVLSDGGNIPSYGSLALKGFAQVQGGDDGSGGHILLKSLKSSVPVTGRRTTGRCNNPHSRLIS